MDSSARLMPRSADATAAIMIHVYIPKKKEKYQVNYVAKNETADDIYQYDYLKTRDKYSVYFGGNQSLVEVKTDSKSKRKLLVVQDSLRTLFYSVYAA